MVDLEIGSPVLPVQVRAPVSDQSSQGNQIAQHKLAKNPEELLVEAEIDSNLVAELRQLIKEEFQKQPDNYCAIHYEHLMDEQSEHTCWRYLVHCQLNLSSTFKLVKSSLAWRKSNHAHEKLDLDDVPKEFWLMSPAVPGGETKQGQLVYYIIGKCYRRQSSVINRAFARLTTRLLFTFDQEHSRDFKQVCLVFDSEGTGFRNFDLEFMSWLVSIRDFIPSRTHSLYSVGIPYLVRPIVRLIISWLPERFSRLVKCGTFDELVEPLIDKSKLPIEFEQSTAKDESYRVAPIDLPWLEDSTMFSDEKSLMALQDAIGFSFDEERKEKLKKMQLEYEKSHPEKELK